MNILLLAIERLLLCVRIFLSTFILPYLTGFFSYENTFGKVWSNHYIFITGCDTGFGNMLAKRLDNRGFSVIANCLTEEGAKKLRAESSSRLHTIVCDITNDKSLAKCVTETERICGKKGLYGLVNNAGIEDDCSLELQAMTSIRRVMEINYFAMANVTQRLMPLLRQAGGLPTGARVVNVASVAGRIALSGMAGYCASKHAVEAYSDSLRREMCMFGIKVSIIEPGLMKTAIVTNSNANKHLMTKWSNLTDEVRAAWGEDFIEFICNSRTKAGALSQDPMKAVYAMENALLQAYPKTRYSVGFDAPIMILSEYFPAFITDCLVSALMPRPSKAKYGTLF
ncbi:hypothetical protein SARC_01715 [Sphaeroforma arctica JP610]|uniref:Uncharacterized protein n=1 Tax=Sphaeroforma arctica JP610 TaxID=667725 RepID=A0A0L0GB82_9EUKA|nr:hypothetical protein SARC_01715 [Sphaeroforma arctica JP610]KNC86146.1 hypothetical protein SARC_01715 [Sphaeroforma arctica JP610]|eukprot:XP_014160048.1 hypothetical protein SARC_01715 [Sphaeroforma arctica JP610]